MRNRRLTPTGPAADPTVATLFREHHGDLVRLAVLIVRDLATAEDVVQDVYASLHSRWSQIAARDTVPAPSSPPPPAPWPHWPAI